MVDVPRHNEGWVRSEAAPTLPPPPNLAGPMGWVNDHLVPNWWNGLLTVLGLVFLGWIAWQIIEWALLKAVFTGADREACIASVEGACWAYVRAWFGQFMYGPYPFAERWRVDLSYLIGIAALVPMLIPSVPYKRENALFLLVAFPIIVLILLSGGNFNFSIATWLFVAVLVGIGAVALPFSTLGIEETLRRDRLPLALAAAGIVLWVLSLFVEPILIPVGGVSLHALKVAVLVLFGVAALLSLAVTVRDGGAESRTAVVNWLGVAVVAFAVLILLSANFGLAPVYTFQWGGLLVTLVVAVTGIVASLPLGILLALGRRSKMPIVRLFSIIFIETWRGVPLITVLFMASVMLPHFLPPGVTFDKLLRVLIGVSLFSAAYMAEVVRGGLQAIPRGQYEAASALGLSYWKSMGLIILPQALKIVIPGIVNSFISLFKDTTLVSIVGIYDLLGIIKEASFADPNWASPQTAPTGYFFAAVMFWIFCFGMSRYSIFMEERLHTGHRR